MRAKTAMIRVPNTGDNYLAGYIDPSIDPGQTTAAV